MGTRYWNAVEALPAWSTLSAEPSSLVLSGLLLHHRKHVSLGNAEGRGISHRTSLGMAYILSKSYDAYIRVITVRSFPPSLACELHLQHRVRGEGMIYLSGRRIGDSKQDPYSIEAAMDCHADSLSHWDTKHACVILENLV